MPATPLQKPPYNQTMTSDFKTSNGILPLVKDNDFVDFRLCLQEIEATCHWMTQLWPIEGLTALKLLLKLPCPHNMNTQSQTPDIILHPTKALESPDFNVRNKDFDKICSPIVPCWSTEWLMSPAPLMTPPCYQHTTSHSKYSQSTPNPTNATHHLDHHPCQNSNIMLTHEYIASQCNSQQMLFAQLLPSSCHPKLILQAVSSASPPPNGSISALRQ